MIRNSKRLLVGLAVGLAAIVVTGCSGYGDYIKSVDRVNDKIDKQAAAFNALRKQEADADTAGYTALGDAAKNDKGDPVSRAVAATGLSNALVAKAARGGAATQSPPVQFVLPAPPKSGMEEAREWFSLALGFWGVHKRAQVDMNRDNKQAEVTLGVQESQSRERIASVGAIRDTAIGLRPAAPNIITTNVGGNQNNGGRQTNDDSTTNNNCSSGNPGPGGTATTQSPPPATGSQANAGSSGASGSLECRR